MILSNDTAQTLYEGIRHLPIVSPHGHTDPAWFAENEPFADAAELLVIPDHYVFRMLYSQGIPLEDLGVGQAGAQTDRREIFRTFARHWHLFLGTPSRQWIEYVLTQTLGISTPLNGENADAVYDAISEKLASNEFLPRSLFESFAIEALATTDGALDDLEHHKSISSSGWAGRVIPTFRPDGVLDPTDPEFSANVQRLGSVSGHDVGTYDGYLAALRDRRKYFRDQGATATDHAIEVLSTEVLSDPESEYKRVLDAPTELEARAFYGHMLIKMAEMSVEDGMVMQLHAGSRRNTNHHVFSTFGRDKGADIPLGTDWVRGLEPLLNRVGNAHGFRLILFTLDEGTYARELAPMAGHWPCLRIGPPWWFHDSPAGIARFFDQAVETAGYWNLAGFNDDTRAFLSIPARHNMWRQGVAEHLSMQISRGHFDMASAQEIARLLATDLARECYCL